jgi:DNA polymerase III subunit delta
LFNTNQRIRILQCEDELALDRIIRDEIAQVNTDPGIAELNISRLDGRANSPAEIATALNAIPFLADFRLVILENATPTGRDETAREKFLRLLENSPETTRIILVLADEYKPSGAGSGWQTIKRDHWLRKWHEEHKEKAGWEELRLPELRGMPAWIQQEARRQGGEITPLAAVELANATGTDTLSAASEIEKLIIYTEANRPVSLQDVQMLCASGDQTNIFDMVEAVTRGNARQGVRLLHQMLEKEDAQVIFGMIVRQFRMLIQAKAILDDRGGVNEVTKALKTADFVSRKLVDQARRFSLEELQGIYRKLLDIDLESKNSTTPWEVALDTFVVEISR